MKKLEIINSVYAIIALSLISRIYAYYYFSDVEIVNEWGIILHNLNTSGILGYNVVLDQFNALPKFAEVGETVIPSAFMPPLYIYFINFIKFMSGGSIDFVKYIIFFQIFLSLISIYIFFKTVRNFEDHKKSIIFTLIFAFLPINIFAAVKISSITLQLFLLVFYFYFLPQHNNNKSIKRLIFFSIISGLLILIRGEFLFFYLITIFYFFIYLNKNFKFFLITIILTFLVTSPYIIRNYQNFNTYVLTKSFGYNLFKGNNPEFRVEGNPVYIEKSYDKGSLKIETNNNYEINLDNFYKQEALTFIFKNPFKSIVFYFQKVFAMTFIDLNSSYPNYYHLLHLIPKIILSIFSLIGSVIVLRKKGFSQFLGIYYLLNIALFSVFFILPRYSLILLPIQLLLSIHAYNFLKTKFINRISNS